eukprot:9179677-Alexandrium_andersonii.AAC.1
MARQRGPFRPDVPMQVRAFQQYYDIGIAARAGISCVGQADDDRGACCGMSGIGARGPLVQCPCCLLLWRPGCQRELLGDFCNAH